MEIERLIELAGVGSEGSVVSEQMLEEGIISKMARVGILTGDSADLHTTGKVFFIKNDNPAVELLIQSLGIPGDGTAFRTGFQGFACYHEDRQLLFFAKYKRDLPTYIDTMNKKKTVSGM